jgi:hypothetical protein
MNDFPYVDKQKRIFKYGDYYPPEHSMWAYNESWGQQYFPLTKELAEKQGFYWHNPPERDYKSTINYMELSDNIKDVKESILNEIIKCEHYDKKCNQQCTEVFRILPNELTLYRSLKIALPRLCPNCRQYERLKMVNPLKLWHRKCMCGGGKSENREYENTIGHFHGDKPCSNEFETAIGPDRKEIIYCKECYQAEFI